jgi:eukaryotic-like serine/threonine-protein kinase
MALSSGTKLGPYEIQSLLGAGGMGEVYRAADSRLGRDVALKVLPEAFARNVERMVRFEREAKVLASLNHPNIASIYGIEESSAARALVMELVEGPTVAERMRQRAIPLEDALPIAKQICEALEYAHERGVIHRDLKPANVKLTLDGSVKLLDFGLAKALEGETTAGDIFSSPTISHLATQAGLILGTAAYMSPEQAKGKAVDRRADIWAFGCVLYEMLTSKQAFNGETATDVLAAVIKEQPEWAALPANTPPRLQELLRRCLTKDLRQRLQAIGEARIALDMVASGIPDIAPASEPAQRPSTQPWLRLLPWALLTIAVLALVVVGYIGRSSNPQQIIISQIAPPENMNFAVSGDFPGPPVLSPDGQRLAFVALGSDSKQKLWVRLLNSVSAHALEGTAGATFPFWSADSRSLAFFAEGKLNRIDAGGGPVIAITDAPQGRGGAWGPDGTILYSPNTGSSLYRVEASGGTSQLMTKLDASRQETSHRWPVFLPDGKHFLFFAYTNLPQQNDSTYAASLDGGEPKLLLRGDSNAVYALPGYLLFVRQRTLMAQRFDANNRSLIGDAVALVENAEVNSFIRRGTFTVSENGILAYQSGNDLSQDTRLLWFDRSGKQIEETGEHGNYGTVSLSPDGKKLAFAMWARGNSSSLNIWVYDLVRRIPTRLTFSTGNDGQPCWSPDGKTIAFVSALTGGLRHLYQKAADGTGNISPLVEDEGEESKPSFSSDGRYVIFERQAQTSSYGEIWALPLFGDRKALPVLQNPQVNMFHPALSPDGKWLAYMSPESGRPDVFVIPFRQGSGRWEVSTAGGRFPRWRHDGKELFYISLDNKIMSAEIASAGESFAVGKLTPLFSVNPAFTSGWPYDVSADGKKFVIDTQVAQNSTQPLTLVLNWPALLKKNQ